MTVTSAPRLWAAASTSRMAAPTGSVASTASTGKPRSSIATGPCRKSAGEAGSAATPVSSLIFNAASKAVA
jgi:hypothetical protein